MSFCRRVWGGPSGLWSNTEDLTEVKGSSLLEVIQRHLAAYGGQRSVPGAQH